MNTKRIEKYLSLDKSRVFHNKTNDSLELSGKAGKTPFKMTIPAGSELDLILRAEMREVGIIPEENTIDLGLPSQAVLDYSDQEFMVSNLVSTVEAKSAIELKASSVTNPLAKLFIPIGVIKDGDEGELHFKTIPFFQKQSGNVFVSGPNEPSKSFFIENIENHLEMFAPEAEIISFDASLKKPDLTQSPRRIVYNNSLEFLSRLRRVRSMYERNHEKARNILVVLHNLHEFTDRPESDKSAWEGKVERAVRAEIVDLIAQISDYNQSSDNLTVTFVVTTAATDLTKYLPALVRSGTIVRFGNSSLRVSKALFGFRTEKIADVAGRGYVLSEGHFTPFQAFFATGEQNHEASNENFREQFNF
jgi:hypothetical protein